MRELLSVIVHNQEGKVRKPLFVWSLITLAVLAAGYGFVSGELTVLTPDQKGYALFEKGRFKEAAEQFNDPMWQGAAYFEAGQFDKAAGFFAGYDSADAAFNQGNSLVMLGKYEDAIERYERALELRPDWSNASTNLAIAKARAERVKKEGSDMTGGRLGADEIVFTKGKSTADAGEEEVEGGQKLSDAEMRAMWLRNVQTKPADFLRAKFAYQQAMSSGASTIKDEEGN